MPKSGLSGAGGGQQWASLPRYALWPRKCVVPGHSQTKERANREHELRPKPARQSSTRWVVPRRLLQQVRHIAIL
jgi:hypothetical protein